VVAIFYNKKKIKETYFNTDSQGITAFTIKPNKMNSVILYHLY
jgi:hypothetical protein